MGQGEAFWWPDAYGYLRLSRELTKEVKGVDDRLEPVHISGEPAPTSLSLVLWGLSLSGDLSVLSSSTVRFSAYYTIFRAMANTTGSGHPHKW